ncbi:complex I subunit 5 family protein [Segeticoccus rhizosphaerae]|jgi:multicomponent Na+:H+ antiporter subunit D|uniref:complex I subunit 5 family protein n=1 Tax=Segeticoccus rhizosphaerae TaxID=1104777 RepID=UPI0010C08C69|nr:proton-conducting transporter membrane subunit [Ornithinicoccus soli]
MTPTTLASLTPLPVVVPLAGAVLSPLLARWSLRLPVIVSVATTAASAAILCLFVPTVLHGKVVSHYFGHWGPSHGSVLGIAFAVDAWGLIFALTTSVVGAVLLLYTLSELGHLGPRELGGYAGLFQLLLAALVAAGLTADIFNLFVWFEVAGLASYGLTGFFLERPIAVEAAFKILVLTTIAGFLILVGIALLYAEHGALGFGALRHSLAVQVSSSDRIALGLLVAGFATKAGLMPFHGWLPDAHTAAPGPVSALFSGLMVNLGLLAIVRLLYQVFPLHATHGLGLLTCLGVVSALLGALLALAQDDLKRVLAYDTVSQMGVLAVGFGTGSPAGTAGATYHLLNHALFKSLLFLVAGAIVHRTGVTKLSQLGGLWRSTPSLTIAFIVGTLSIAGAPPFNGYVSLGLIHEGVATTGEHVVYGVMLLAQVLTIAALARAVWLGFLRPRQSAYENEAKARPGMLTALAALAALCLAFGVLGEAALSRLMAPAAAGLLHPHGYVKSLLAPPVARVSPVVVHWSYWERKELAIVVVTVLLGICLVPLYLRRDEPHAVTALRRLHSGSVNDYAAYLSLGAILVVAGFALR